jgi:hypothetical protein
MRKRGGGREQNITRERDSSRVEESLHTQRVSAGHSIGHGHHLRGVSFFQESEERDNKQTTNFDGSLQLEEHRLVGEDLFGTNTEPLDLGFREVDLFPWSGSAH